MGPLNALEADRYIEDLRPFEFADFGDGKWMHQHEFITKLNLQAHVNASQDRDEFVLEAIVLHEKMPLLIRELIATELWKQNAYPLIKDWIDKNNSIKGYLMLYQEGVLCNLLETLLYHKQGCEAAGDLILELVDYCHRKLMFLLNAPKPHRPKDKEELKQAMLKEAEDTQSEQEKSIAMSCALCCVSIVRFFTDHIEELPLAVTARILDTYDLLMVLCPMLEQKPWQAEGEDGEMRRFVQGHWARVPEAEARKMAKAEAQCWLAVYNLVITPSVRKRYQFNSYRKNIILRVRKYLHETTVDQIPILVDLMRSLDEMTLQDPPSAAEARPAYVMEQMPELRESMSRGVDWHKVVEKQKAEALNDSEAEKRAQAMQMAGVFEMDGMEELLAKELGQTKERELSYYCQITISDATSGREHARMLAESENDSLAPQSAFVIPAEQKQTLVPTSANGMATVVASLNLGSNTPYEVKGTYEVAEGKKKQWLQLGFDPYGLRVQLHVLTPPNGSGSHIIHARVTPPPPCVLTIAFKGKKDGEVRQVRAKGRGVQAQTPYEVDMVDQGIRIPKLSSASATLSVNAGGGDAEETCECPSADLGLSGATQMVWRQLGSDPSGLRVQLKLAPANEGGYAITAIRVTPPSIYRTATDKAPVGNTAVAGTKPPASKPAPAPAPAPAPVPAPAPAPAPAAPVPVGDNDDDDDERIVEIEPEVTPPAPSKPPASAMAVTPPVADAPPGGPFIAASAFSGAKEGYVFKKGADGLGYYLDAKKGPSDKKGVSFEAPPLDASSSSKVPPPTAPVDEAAAAMKSAADALFAKGDAAGAAAAYTELLAAMPPSTPIGHTALSNRSACHLAQQHWEDCAADCDEALSAARQDLPARAKVKLHLRRAEARMALGLRELARSDVREAAHIVPSDDAAGSKQIAAFKERLGGLSSVAADAVKPNHGLTNLAVSAGGEGKAPAIEAPASEVRPKVDVSVNGEKPGRSLTLNVNLPGVRTLNDITLEISNSSVHVSGAGFLLDETLPFAVDSDAASAKFSAKAGVLRVRAPEA